MSEKVLGAIFVGVILYFGLQAMDAVAYNERIGRLLLAKDEGDTLSHVMGFLFAYARIAILILTGALVGLIFRYPEEDGTAPVFLLILWAVLGWWVGDQFTEAVAEKQACLSKSLLGFGCIMDGPLFSYLLYALISYLLAFALASLLLSAFGQEKAGAIAAGENEEEDTPEQKRLPAPKNDEARNE